MVYYVIAVFFEYVIAFGLAVLLNTEIRARRFFRVVFLLPFMLSPVAVSWMIGMAALSTAAILPLIIVGILLERYIIKGLTAGAVK